MRTPSPIGLLLDVDGPVASTTTRTVPEVVSISRGTSPTRVVLPDPERPSTATNSPSGDLQVDPVEHRAVTENFCHAA